MTTSKAYSLGARATCCTVICESGRYGNEWVVKCEGRIIASGSVRYCTRFVRDLHDLEVAEVPA